MGKIEHHPRRGFGRPNSGWRSSGYWEAELDWISRQVRMDVWARVGVG